MRGQISTLFLVLFIFISALTAVFTGCNQIDQRYFTMLDTLDNNLSQNRELLEIDYKTIENRKQMIEDHLRLVEMFITDTMSAEFGKQLSKYKGVRKVYQKFLNDYSHCYNELEVLEKQAVDLRQSVNEKQLSKEDFKVFYNKEKADGLANLMKSKKLIEPIHSVEPDYQRISRIVAERLTQMAKSNQELDSILKKMIDK